LLTYLKGEEEYRQHSASLGDVTTITLSKKPAAGFQERAEPAS
jgi:hypothetical protein